MINYLKNGEVNKPAWDACIAQAKTLVPYGLSGYLDIVSPGWNALVYQDYQAVMPLPTRTKWGFDYIYTPTLVQQLGVFGTGVNAELLKKFMEAVPANYRFAEYNMNEQNNMIGIGGRNNTLLFLNKNYPDLFNEYSDNHKRNIKKTAKYNLQLVSNIDLNLIIDLFAAEKGKEYQAYVADVKPLLPAIAALQAPNFGSYTMGVTNADGQLLCAALFITYFNRHIFLFSGNSTEGKHHNAMHFLLDSVIQQNASTNMVLDFEGSVNSNLARFYLGFGGYTVRYPHYRFNKLPIWAAWLKK